jgi:hypothetical protein
VDAQQSFDQVDWWAFGNHRVAFYGDYRQAFADSATLLGYDVVEEDKQRA